MNLSSGRAWLGRWYAACVIAIWVFAPEVRRVVDWETTFHFLSPFSILPLLSLVPGLFLLRSHWGRMGTGYRRVSVLWLIAFGYAFMIACLTESPLAASYELSLFLLPMLMGVILSAGPSDGIETAFDRLAGAVLWLALATSIYGIWQYVAPPAWDSYWAQSANIEGSQGETVAFGFRIFGTLNSSGIFAVFLFGALVMNFPRFSRSRWWLPVVMAPIAIAMILTLVRLSWIEVAVGAAVYFALSPRRLAMSTSIIATSVSLIALGAVLIWAVPAANGTVTKFTDRLSTFGQLDQDRSANVHRDTTIDALKDALAEPLGQGLGTIGTSARLTTGSTNVVDSGYLARFVEMGIVGVAFYLASLLTAVAVTFQSYRAYILAGNRSAASIVAGALAIQIAMLVAQLADDQFASFSGMIFWISLYFATGFTPPLGSRVEKEAISRISSAPQTA